MPLIQRYQYNVFLASPSDTAEERAATQEVVANVNATLNAMEHEITLEILPWERLPRGGHPLGTQHYIYEQYPVEKWGIVIGIFKKKFGSPNSALSGRSNTEDEILRGLEFWHQTGLPFMRIYFSTDNDPTTPHEAEELRKIEALKHRLQESHLTFTFTSIDEFKLRLTQDLLTSALQLKRKERISSVDESLRCRVDAQPVVARAEGVTERTSEITLTFSGGRLDQGEGESYFYNIELWTSPSVNITNATYGEREGRGGTTDAALTFLSLEDFDVPHCHLAIRKAPHRISFECVEVRPSKASKTIAIRISNVRVNCSQLRVLSGSSANVALVVVAKPLPGGTPALDIEKPAPTVAIARNSLVFRVCSAKPDAARFMFSSREGINDRFQVEEIVAGQVGPDLYLKFLELHASVWKSVEEEGSFLRQVPIGPKSSATRFIARFSNVPPGVRLFLGVDAVSERGHCRGVLIESDPNGVGGRWVFRGASRFFEVALVSGVGQAVWEWADRTSSYRSEPELIMIPVVLRAGSGEASVGTANVNGNLAPISTVSGARHAAPVPRFVDTAANRIFFESTD